jgi:hypothetical protein
MDGLVAQRDWGDAAVRLGYRPVILDEHVGFEEFIQIRHVESEFGQPGHDFPDRTAVFLARMSRESRDLLSSSRLISLGLRAGQSHVHCT